MPPTACQGDGEQALAADLGCEQRRIIACEALHLTRQPFWRRWLGSGRERRR
jgi:hypothetical protein